jgi:hypothetical protein
MLPTPSNKPPRRANRMFTFRYRLFRSSKWARFACSVDKSFACAIVFEPECNILFRAFYSKCTARILRRSTKRNLIRGSEMGQCPTVTIKMKALLAVVASTTTMAFKHFAQFKSDFDRRKP